MDRPYILRFAGPDAAAEAVPSAGAHQSEMAAATSTLSYRTARTRSDLVGAFELLQRRYSEAGLAQADAPTMRMMPYHLTSASQVFVARSAAQVIGTVTLVCDCPGRLPISGGYPHIMAQFQSQSLRIAEVASLAIEPSAIDPGTASRAEIFGELTRLLTFFARAQGFDYLAAVVHPRHAKFYRHAMGFEIIGEEIRCAAVGGQPGIALLTNIEDPDRYRPRWRSYYFDGQFTADDLQPRPISHQDRQHFAALGYRDERKAA